MDTIDTQLDIATAKVGELESLLTDLTASNDVLKQNKITLETANGELQESLASSIEKLGKLEASHREAKEEIASLQATAQTAEEKAAEFYGASHAAPAATATMGEAPLPVADRFRAIQDPTKQTEFLRSLNKAERTELFANI